MLPTFINCITIFAFCNLDDLSWGTKGLDDQAGDGDKKGGGLSMKEKRTLSILLLLLLNSAWTQIAFKFIDGACFLTWLTIFIGYYNGTKIITSSIHAVLPFARCLHASYKTPSAPLPSATPGSIAAQSASKPQANDTGAIAARVVLGQSRFSV
jgi:hypothetical protein